jgi:hypothetical protein
MVLLIAFDLPNAIGCSYCPHHGNGAQNNIVVKEGDEL